MFMLAIHEVKPGDYQNARGLMHTYTGSQSRGRLTAAPRLPGGTTSSACQALEYQCLAGLFMYVSGVFLA